MTAAKLRSLLLYIFASLILSRQIPLNLVQFLKLWWPLQYCQTKLKHTVLTQELSQRLCTSFSVRGETIPGMNSG